MPVFKVWNAARTNKRCIVASSLSDVICNGKKYYSDFAQLFLGTLDAVVPQFYCCSISYCIKILTTWEFLPYCIVLVSVASDTITAILGWKEVTF